MNASIVAEKQVASVADAVRVGRADLGAYVRRIHDGALQEVATLRVALSVWARAADAGDAETAKTMVLEVRLATDRLLDELNAMEQKGRYWLDDDKTP